MLKLQSQNTVHLLLIHVFIMFAVIIFELWLLLLLPTSLPCPFPSMSTGYPSPLYSMAVQD